MWFLILLVAFALIALVIVSAISHAQEQERKRRLQQRKLKIQVDALTEIVNCLEQTIPNQLIIKLINDEIIILLRRILALEKVHSPYIENLIRLAYMRSTELAAGTMQTAPSYQKDSDALISQTQAHLTETGTLLRHIAAQGKISDAELKIYIEELSWAYLMVSVASFIAQGQRFTAQEEQMMAHSFYQKAQNLLMESMHQDTRRLRMIRELAEMIEGTRKYMSRELVALH